MESDQPHLLPALPAPETTRCCTCTCHCCASRTTWRRSVKRRLDDAFAAPSPASMVVVNEEVPAARVEADDEVAALREALVSHQQTVQELCIELEEERSAASTAASEAMSMILRLQREKAEAQMECRQFKRLAEERMAHDQRELASLDDLLLRRDHALRSLSLQLQSYRLRILSFGIDPDSVDLYSDAPGSPTTLTSGTPKVSADGLRPTEAPPFDYPPLRCNIPADLEEDYYEEDENTELENYCETPLIHEDLHNLHYRVNQFERNPSMPPLNRPVVVPAAHLLQSSTDIFNSREELPNRGPGYYDDKDDVDRVYTIDAIHGPPVVPGVCNERIDMLSSVNESKGTSWVAGGGEEGDIKKLYARLQALEADRESMRQALFSMRTEKAQFVLLREIAQHLCKEVVAPQKVIKKQASFIRSISVLSVVKWILSFVFWKRKATCSKYTFGRSNNNNGLLLLLERSPRMGHWRRLSRLRE